MTSPSRVQFNPIVPSSEAESPAEKRQLRQRKPSDSKRSSPTASPDIKLEIQKDAMIQDIDAVIGEKMEGDHCQYNRILTVTLVDEEHVRPEIMDSECQTILSIRRLSSNQKDMKTVEVSRISRRSQTTKKTAGKYLLVTAC